MSEPTVLHRVDGAAWVDPEPTAALPQELRVPTKPAPATAHPLRSSNTGLLVGLAAFAGILSFVLAGLIAAGADDAEPPEPLRTQPLEATAVPPTVATVPTTAPPAVGAETQRDERESDRERDRPNEKRDEEREDRDEREKDRDD